MYGSNIRGPFGSPHELRAATQYVRRATLHLLDSADHGFAVRTSGGRTREDVRADAVAAMVEWIGWL